MQAALRRKLNANVGFPLRVLAVSVKKEKRKSLELVPQKCLQKVLEIPEDPRSQVPRLDQSPRSRTEDTGVRVDLVDLLCAKWLALCCHHFFFF